MDAAAQFLVQTDAGWMVRVEGLEDETATFAERDDAAVFLAQTLEGVYFQVARGKWRWRIPNRFGRGGGVAKTAGAAVLARRAALRRLDRLGGAGQVAVHPPPRKRYEIFDEAAARVVDIQHLKKGMTTWGDRLQRLLKYASPCIGTTPVDQVRRRDIERVLQRAADAGRSAQTVRHLRNDLSSIFRQLRREGVLDIMPTTDVEMPDMPRTDTKERATLSDDELLAYLAWVHPQKGRQRAVLERQTMACVSRMFGGLRTGDLHALHWEALDPPEFQHGWAPRRKTKRPQLLEIPELLRPIIQRWWDEAGRPTAGLVFPAGKRAIRGQHRGQKGQQRTEVSHAVAFRVDLRRALGIDAPEMVESVRSNGKRLRRLTWKQARPMTPREIELFEPTDYTLPVDFHSFRRSYNQALAIAGVNAQQAMALAGHSSLAAHERYLRAAGAMAHVPEAALPRLPTRADLCPKVDPVSNSEEDAAE